jgi:hypothetical protein
MQAQRARWRKAIKSYESKRAIAYNSISAPELTGHEAHVSVKAVRGTIARVQICSSAAQEQVGLRDHTIEIGYFRGIVSSYRVDALNRTREKMVDRRAKWSSDCMWVWLWVCRA